MTTKLCINGMAAIGLLGLSAACLAEDAAEPAAPAGPFAIENFTANVALASDYRFRGISQTDGFAIQGGMDWAYQGFFLGTWASNTEFSDENIEVDIYGGYGWSWLGMNLKAQVIYYMYPGDSSTEAEGIDPPGYDSGLGLRPGDAGTMYAEPCPTTVFLCEPGDVQPYSGEFPNIDTDFLELNFGVSHTLSAIIWTPTVGVDYNYSPDFFGDDGDSHAVTFSTGATLPIGLAPYFKFGYQDVEGDEFSAFLGTPSGYDWWWFSAGVTYQLVGFTLNLSYHWVDRGDTCGGPNQPLCDFNGGFDTYYSDYPYIGEGGTSTRDLTDDAVVFSISRVF
jgi:Bacterial protein of unknown function (Gcw_chp)